MNQKNKIIAYYQWGQKLQANRLPQGTYTYTDPGQTFKQDSGSWVWKGEWNGTVSDKLYVEARYGDFGYYFPQIANSDLGYWFRDTGTLTLEGSPQRQQNDRDRKQITGAATYFLDTGKGSHTFKFGGESLKEKQWVGFKDGVGGNRDLQYSNGRSSQIVFWFPTARDVGSLSTDNNGDTYVGNNLSVLGAFVNDTWAVGRATVNMGVRWDRYDNWLPDQKQVAFTHGIDKLSIPDATFAKADLNTWNSFAPRIGFVYDLTGNGRSVVKANYGLYWHNPGVGLSASINPNQSSKNVTYAWNDLNGDKRWQPGEEGASPTASNLAGAISMDPNLKQPYTHEAGFFFEQQLSDVIGTRVGYVYKTEDDLFESFQTNRPPSVYIDGVPLRRHRRGRRARHGGRQDDHALRHAVGRRVEVPREPGHHQRGAVRPVQDGRGLDDQALLEQVVGVGGRQLHDAQQLPDRLVPADAEPPRCVRPHPVGLQGHGLLRCGLRHPDLARAASPGRSPVRAHHLGARLCGYRVWRDRPGDDHLRRFGVGQPPGQHHGGRHPRGEDVGARQEGARARLLRPLQPDQQPRLRDGDGGDGFDLPAAVGHPRAHHGAGGLPLPLVNGLARRF